MSTKRESHSSHRKRHSSSKHSHSHSSHHHHHHDSNNNINSHHKHRHSKNYSDLHRRSAPPKRPHLKISLGAAPIQSLIQNTKKAQSKPAMHSSSHTYTYNHDYSGYKKRESAPIILPTSTTPSVLTNSDALTASINGGNTPYYTNANVSKTKSMIDQNNKSSDDHSAHSESDDYLDEHEINEMIKTCRRRSKSKSHSKSRPRAYSKSRRVSQKLFGLMESISSDNNGYNNNNNNLVDNDVELTPDSMASESETSESENESDLQREREEHDYNDTLLKYGYVEIKTIAKSLQGIVIEAKKVNDKDSDSVIIKITDKQLHINKISNKHGKSLSVQEDIIKEKKLLMYLTANNPPASLVKFKGFFQDKFNYYLVMENGGSDFFDWIVKCHKWIRAGKLSLKQWSLYIRDLMLQIIKFLKWMHCKMNVCHLDISLENMLIKNNKYKSDGNGGIRLSRKMQIKICDFGLAEYFDPKQNDLFLCNKYVGKTHYKAPKVYGKKLTFDARKADIWSLGVSFFMMIVGAPPYKLPLDTDDHFPFVQRNDVNGILKRWGREQYIDKSMESLLNNMLQIDERKRYSVHDIVRHLTTKHHHNKKPTNYSHLHRRSQPAHSSYRVHSSHHHKKQSRKRKKSKKPSNPIHAYHDDDVLLESVNNHKHAKIKTNHNIFAHLVMDDDDGQLFRYRKRRMDSPST